MPTGYTAAVVDGAITDLEPFVWQLARGMGALIMMRDEPHNAPVPERFEPSDYHAKKLAESQAERARVLAMTEAEATEAARGEVAKSNEGLERGRAEHEARRERYKAMIAKVEAWQGAPEGIKEFALEQLRTGMDFDCPAEFRWYRDRPSGDGEEWRRVALERLAKDISYHADEWSKEEARTESCNAWLAQLRASLAGNAARQTLPA